MYIAIFIVFSIILLGSGISLLLYSDGKLGTPTESFLGKFMSAYVGLMLVFAPFQIFLSLNKK